MRVRVIASFLLALAGAVVLIVSLQSRAADRRHQTLQSAAAVGTPAVSPRTPADAYLAALAAFRGVKHTPTKTSGQREVIVAAALQRIREALAADQPTAQRSQLENLAGALEQRLAGLGGAEASAHKRAAAHWLQRAVLADDTNDDAKFNLELLMSRNPQSARKQPQPASGEKAEGPKGTQKQKGNGPKSGVLRGGF